MTTGERQKATTFLRDKGFTTEQIRAFLDYVEPGAQTAAAERIRTEYPEFAYMIDDTADLVDAASWLDSFY